MEKPVAIIDVESNNMSIANNVDAMFSFGEDDLWQAEPEKPEIIQDTLPIEEPEVEEETEEPQNEEPEQVESSEQEFEEYTKPALLGLALKEESDLFADLEIDKKADASTLINQITSSYTKKIEEVKEAIKSEYEQVSEYYQMMKRGDVDVLNSVATLDNILEVDIDQNPEEEVLKQIVAYTNALKSISQEDSNDLIETYLDKGVLAAKAAESQQYIANYKSNLINSKLEEYKIQEEQELLQRQQIKENVKSFLNNDVTIKSVVKDPELIYKTMFEETEVIKYKDEKGNNRIVKVPKINLLMEEFQNNIQKQIIFTQLLLNNFSLDDVALIKEKKTTKQIINLLEDKPSPKNKWVDKLN